MRRAAKDEALSADIQFLGSLLGETLRRHGGRKLFDIEERARALCKEMRSTPSAATERKLTRLLSRLDLDDTVATGLHHVQREHILRELNATRWVIEGNSGAALKLGMKPATLRHRMKKLGIALLRHQP
jgi:transcriptional regulator with GAF, ATPase, and Fis domain